MILTDLVISSSRIINGQGWVIIEQKVQRDGNKQDWVPDLFLSLTMHLEEVIKLSMLQFIHLPNGDNVISPYLQD